MAASRSTLAPASLAPPPFAPRRVQAGPWTLTALTDGFFNLDGGSMWGVVPKSMWARMTPCAQDNTILLALRPFLAEREGVRAVIEVGLGERWDAKWQGIYRMQREVSLAGALGVLGVAPSEVTHVVASHCHFDHIGAQVALVDGELVPLFPNARHFAPSIEIEIARRPGHARAASYRAEDVEPLLERGLLEGYAGSTELLPGLRVHVLGGHSDGVSVVTFNEHGDEGDTAIFWSDVVPTAHHVQPAYIMAYDIDVVRSFDVRTEWLERAARGAWIGLFYHDPDHAFGRVRRVGGRLVCEPEEGLPCASSRSARA